MKRFSLLIFLFLSYIVSTYGQSLKMPESIAWDDTQSVYYISNTQSGTILKMNESKELFSFITGLTNPRGICIAFDLLYTVANSKFIAFDLATGNKVFEHTLPEAIMLNDVVYDGDNKIYISDMGGNQFFEYTITSEYNIPIKLVLNNEVISPNGLYYENQNIYVVSFSENASIYEINLLNNEVTTKASTNLNYLDGITKDENNNFYVTAWGNSVGSLFKFNSDFSNNPMSIKTDLNGPADMIYRQDLQTIIIPLMNDNKIEFVLVGTPPKVELTSPENEAQLEDFKVTFQWKEISGATNYLLEVAKDIEFTDKYIERNYNIAKSDLLGFDTSKTYYWRVKAFNMENGGEWSEIRSFTTGNLVYYPPTPLEPPHNTTNVSSNPKLVWSKSIAGVYEVQLSKTDNFAQIVWSAKDLLDTTIIVTPSLTANTDYYWRIRSYSGISTSDWSAVSKFRTYDTPPPAPDLVFPGNLNPNIYPKFGFEWYGESDAETYIINLCELAAFPEETTYKYYPVSTNSYIERFEVPDSMKYSTKYFWRMKSVNSFGESNWSELWSFYIINKGEDTTLTIVESESYKISISPNPSSEYIDINILQDVDNGQFAIEIYDINGNPEFIERLESGIKTKRISMNEFSAGSYLVYIKENGTIVKRVKIIKN